jgi:HrpA-like RNA helicase
MSATIDTTKFADYFDEAPLIEIPGRTFPVEDLYVPNDGEANAYLFSQSYLEDIVSKLDYRCPPQIKPIHKWTPDDRQTFQSNLQSKTIPDKHFRSLENLSRSDLIDYEVTLSYLTSY